MSFSRLLSVFILTVVLAACSTGIASNRAFSDAKWQPSASCDPVNIVDTVQTKIKDPVFDFKRVSYRRSGAAGGPIFELGEGASLQYEGKKYSVRLLRIIAPSEHRVLGMSFLLELQFFAVAEDGTPIALSVFARKGKENPALRSMIVDGSGELTLSDLKSTYSGHYFYKGALPVSPCYAIPFIVMKSAVEISAEDLDEYLNRWPYVERTAGHADRIEETE